MENKLHYSDEALEDLADISLYINNQLQNPIAAANTVEGIFRTVRRLKNFPNAGAIVYFSNGSDSGYRFIMYKSYMIFYRVNGTDVFVDRIVYGRRDYMKILFG